VNVLAEYENVFEILKYLASQLDISFLTDYMEYIVIGLIICVVFIVIFQIFKAKRKPKEYLNDAVCLKMVIPPMSDKFEILRSFLNKLYTRMSSSHKKKFHFSLELLCKKDQKDLFLVVPSIIYNENRDLFEQDVVFDIVTDLREKFIDSIRESNTALELELKKDFVYPLKLKFKSSQNILNEGEWIFFQIPLRPAGDTWKTVLTRYKNDLRKGKDKMTRFTGCLGGCIGVSLPFFSMIANVLTGIFHGSSSTKEDHTQNERISPEIKRKLDIVNSKSEQYGFEISVRTVISTTNSERMYEILDKLLDITTQEDPEWNSFVVKTLHKRVKETLKNEMVLGRLETSTIDVVSSDEVLSLVTPFM
jgi:hypothetical protein